MVFISSCESVLSFQSPKPPQPCLFFYSGTCTSYLTGLLSRRFAGAVKLGIMWPLILTVGAQHGQKLNSWSFDHEPIAPANGCVGEVAGREPTCTGKGVTEARSATLLLHQAHFLQFWSFFFEKSLAQALLEPGTFSASNGRSDQSAIV